MKPESDQEARRAGIGMRQSKTIDGRAFITKSVGSDPTAINRCSRFVAVRTQQLVPRVAEKKLATNLLVAHLPKVSSHARQTAIGSKSTVRFNHQRCSCGLPSKIFPQELLQAEHSEASTAVVACKLSHLFPILRHRDTPSKMMTPSSSPQVRASLPSRPQDTSQVDHQSTCTWPSDVGLSHVLPQPLEETLLNNQIQPRSVATNGAVELFNMQLAGTEQSKTHEGDVQVVENAMKILEDRAADLLLAHSLATGWPQEQNPPLAEAMNQMSQASDESQGGAVGHVNHLTEAIDMCKDNPAIPPQAPFPPGSDPLTSEDLGQLRSSSEPLKTSHDHNVAPEPPAPVQPVALATHPIPSDTLNRACSPQFQPVVLIRRISGPPILTHSMLPAARPVSQVLQQPDTKEDRAPMVGSSTQGLAAGPVPTGSAAVTGAFDALPVPKLYEDQNAIMPLTISLPAQGSQNSVCIQNDIVHRATSTQPSILPETWPLFFSTASCESTGRQQDLQGPSHRNGMSSWECPGPAPQNGLTQEFLMGQTPQCLASALPVTPNLFGTVVEGLAAHSSHVSEAGGLAIGHPVSITPCLIHYGIPQHQHTAATSVAHTASWGLLMPLLQQSAPGHPGVALLTSPCPPSVLDFKEEDASDKATGPAAEDGTQARGIPGLSERAGRSNTDRYFPSLAQESVWRDGGRHRESRNTEARVRPPGCTRTSVRRIRLPARYQTGGLSRHCFVVSWLGTVEHFKPVCISMAQIPTLGAGGLRRLWDYVGTVPKMKADERAAGVTCFRAGVCVEKRSDGLASGILCLNELRNW